MLKSQALAKIIVEKYINSTPPEDVEFAISTMIENLILTEISKYVNMKNTENALKANEKQILPKQEIEGVKRVQVWPRGR